MLCLISKLAALHIFRTRGELSDYVLAQGILKRAKLHFMQAHTQFTNAVILQTLTPENLFHLLHFNTQESTEQVYYVGHI